MTGTDRIRAAWAAMLIVVVWQPRVWAQPLNDNYHREYDYGVVDQGTIVEHVFTVVNTGVAPLRILDKKVSCASCVTVMCDWRSLQPGELGRVVVRLDTHRKQGVLEQWGALVTDSAEMPLIKFTINGAVRSAWLAPRRVDLGTVHFGETREIPYVLRAVGMDGAILKAIQSSDPAVLQAVPAPHESQSRDQSDSRVKTLARGVLKWTTPIDRVGVVSESIRATFEFDGTLYKVTMPIHASIGGLIRANPTQIYFGRVNRDTVVERQLVLETPEDSTISLDRLVLSAEHGFVKCSRLSIDEGGLKIVVRLFGSAAIEHGVIRGTIIGRCDQRLVCVIPYTFFALGAVDNGNDRVERATKAQPRPSEAKQQGSNTL